MAYSFLTLKERAYKQAVGRIGSAVVSIGRCLQSGQIRYLDHYLWFAS